MFRLLSLPAASLLAALPICLALGWTQPVSAAAASAPAAKARIDKTAASKTKSAKPVATKTPLLTPDQLRNCENLKGSLRAESDAVAVARKELDANRVGIDKSAAAMKEELETLDRTSQEAVDAFNAKAVQRDQSIDAFQAKATAFNAKLANVGTLQDNYAKSCEARRYDDRDLADLKRGKK